MFQLHLQVKLKSQATAWTRIDCPFVIQADKTTALQHDIAAYVHCTFFSKPSNQWFYQRTWNRLNEDEAHKYRHQIPHLWGTTIHQLNLGLIISQRVGELHHRTNKKGFLFPAFIAQYRISSWHLMCQWPRNGGLFKEPISKLYRVLWGVNMYVIVKKQNKKKTQR